MLHAAVIMLLLPSLPGERVCAVELWCEYSKEIAVLHVGLDWPAEWGYPESVLLRAQGQEWTCPLSFAWVKDAGGQVWRFQGALMIPLGRGDEVASWIVYRRGGRRCEHPAGRLRVGGFRK